MFVKNKTLSVLLKALTALAGLTGLIIQFGIFEGKMNFPMFNYFTVLSNLFAVVYFILAIAWLLKKDRKSEETTAFPAVKGMATVAVTLTMLVVHFMLGPMFVNASGAFGLSLTLLHYVLPLMTIADWLLFDQKGQMKAYFPFVWLIAPFFYLVYAMIASQIGDGIGFLNKTRYPYPFLDIDKLGIPTVTITVLCMSLGLVALGYLLWLADYLLGKVGKK